MKEIKITRFGKDIKYAPELADDPDVKYTPEYVQISSKELLGLTHQVEVLMKSVSELEAAVLELRGKVKK